MQNISPGQRWISDSELDMGMGTVMAVEHRTISIVFPATGETRIYARQTAPLTRVQFAPGDTIRNQDDATLHVESVSEQEGLLFYSGKDDQGAFAVWPESELNNAIQLNRPRERLISGQIDANKWFELRYQTLLHTNRLARSDLYGLIGARTSLIPHQLFIAHEVASRYAPRVLLADEVGLGKTIEAGLILHQQLLTGRASRVLIVVPETLVHQWLVEMLRRFNLHFSIFDEERCAAIEESSGQDNPFDSEQLVLCSLDFLAANPTRVKQALQAQWDFLVVDEAHHLQWTPENSSPEYQIVEAISNKTEGVLLLTATPEQLGKEGHFARLRLLDPDRFPDYEQFLHEEEHYRPVAEAVEELLSEQTTPDTISEKTVNTIKSTLSEEDNEALLQAFFAASSSEETVAEIKESLITNLLDRHGTGRVLFRNTRAAIKGFPAREVHAYPLPQPEEYSLQYKKYLADNAPLDLAKTKTLLAPELMFPQGAIQQAWAKFDPRVQWLQDKIRALKPHKILVIAANASTAIALSQELKANTGLHVPVFHEGLSIIERDRIAAHFADMEYGGQVLICSEIGSEGRNFQFAHHLVLFDLPINPDLLEQRIGRLDRIGQKETIQIHVPYLDASPQSLIYHWYQEGLSAFEKTCPVGQKIFQAVEPHLYESLANPEEAPLRGDLLAKTRALSDELNEALQHGRDLLLEYNSCLPSVAEALCAKAHSLDDSADIQQYLESVFDCFGVDTDIHSTECYILRPGEHMHTHFPGLADDGMTVTFSRNIALSNEDVQFITWEHPLTEGAFDMVLNNESGNTALVAVESRDLQPGTMYIECIHVLECSAQINAQTRRYLPPAIIRVLVDKNGKECSKALPHKKINATMIPVDAETASTVVRTHTVELRHMLDASEQLAEDRCPDFVQASRVKSTEALESEINRLHALKQCNPNVRDEEIRYFETQKDLVNKALDTAKFRLDAVRIVIAT